MKKARVCPSAGWAGCVALGVALLLFAGMPMSAQESSDGLNLSWTSGARLPVDASTVYHHAKPANTPAGTTMRAEQVASLKANKANDQPASAGGILQYPGDVTYLGGPVVEFAQFHPIYLLPNGNCPIFVCWGHPENFLHDLEHSDFIHLTDQYVGLSASNRYTVGERAFVTYKPPKTPLTDADMQFIVYLVASVLGTGYGHIYHLFLPPGQDQCFTSADIQCYSPDNPNSFAYCAYHSSVDFADIGHVLYTVEPYQDVLGCSVTPGSPNGQLTDSTDSVLSHESIETITDPDGDAWINFSQLLMFGEEIGDECEFITFVGKNQTAYFNPPTFKINGTPYRVQSEYSNTVHACGTAP